MKLIGPFHGLGASGQFAGSLTFSTRKSGSQVRFQRKQKDVITAARTAHRAKFLTAVEMWPVYDVGIAECGFVLCGGDNVLISSLKRNQRAPRFARFVSDVINFYS